MKFDLTAVYKFVYFDQLRTNAGSPYGFIAAVMEKNHRIHRADLSCATLPTIEVGAELGVAER